MKVRLTLASMVIILLSACNTQPKDTITISGKVKFPDNKYKVYISQYRDGEKVVTDSFQLAEDGSYSYNMNTSQPGEYNLDCQKWQSVRFWAEDEDLNIDFRGQDTAKIKIKNPPYVYINGGPKNEVMNHLNFVNYRSYQLIIGLSQTVYKATKDVPEKYGEIAGQLYGFASDDDRARFRFLAQQYADRNSVLAVISRLRDKTDKDIIDQTLATLEKTNPTYPPLLKYIKDKEEARAAAEKVKLGKVAPHFSYPTPEGVMVSPEDYKGKIVVIDFWASWCGPCRSEIPHLKEVYEKYHSKGVEMLSVSIDKKEADWHKALAEENMAWAQVLAPNAGKQTMKDYQFSGIPFIIILDKDGKIVAKQLRGKKIDEKLDELLSK
ncbi:AhpC/TSA family protein [Carboxylicivirga sp. A043]|uniref:TlpA family protein disulfide reductase n=1 Tax=Carboxylicivirga litoralis TaxID=2816963 RepID=UPI0021CB15C6|nr:TlpA disulfide reductase family protein [Carboxylicivirga sp. A043]MCU4154346.1 AhpC/TSA family protein [Carboxylicivirga sp. A043]